jgi:hypothetical protein
MNKQETFRSSEQKLILKKENCVCMCVCVLKECSHAIIEQVGTNSAVKASTLETKEVLII